MKTFSYAVGGRHKKTCLQSQFSNHIVYNTECRIKNTSNFRNDLFGMLNDVF